MPERDFVKYWQSLGKDLEATKDRVRNLIGNRHWLAEGTYKEIILKNALERHLPESLKICTGFVVSDVNISTQIDLLIIDKSAFTLFKESNLVIVAPSAVRAIIEVKTALKGPSDINKTLEKLAENSRLSQDRLSPGPFWAGLFVFEERADRQKELLRALKKTKSVHCVSCGSNTFIRRWDNHPDVGEPCWVSYRLRNLAAGYFIGNIIAKLTKYIGHEEGHVIFPIEGTKETKREFYIEAHGQTNRVKRFRETQRT